MRTATSPARSIQRSWGHLCFGVRYPAGLWEYFDIRGEVYRAPVGPQDVFDIDTHTRFGRWECSRIHFDADRGYIVGEEV
jgi:hypothetical protein